MWFLCVCVCVGACVACVHKSVYICFCTLRTDVSLTCVAGGASSSVLVGGQDRHLSVWYSLEPFWSCSVLALCTGCHKGHLCHLGPPLHHTCLLVKDHADPHPLPQTHPSLFCLAACPQHQSHDCRCDQQPHRHWISCSCRLMLLQNKTGNISPKPYL